MSRRYIIQDLQGGTFGNWSWQEPATRQEIIEHFRELINYDNLPISRNLSLTAISEIWEINIHRVDTPIKPCPKCECPTYKNKCPICDNF